MRVLIIENEEKTADYLHRGLTEQGYTVDVARDGVEGLHLALTITSANRFPSSNGWRVYKR